MFRSHTIRAGFCFYLRPTNPYGFFPSQIQLAEISKNLSRCDSTLSSFGGGVADKDLTFNQKFLRLSGPVEELVGVGVFVGSGAIWSELVTCKISELKKLPPRFPKHILVHTYICNI